MPVEPHDLVQALLDICEAQHRCLDDEDLEGVLRLADERDLLQDQLMAWESVPEAFQAPLRRLAKEGDRLIERMAQLAEVWMAQQSQDTQRAQGLQLYVQEAQSPVEARFLDGFK